MDFLLHSILRYQSYYLGCQENLNVRSACTDFIQVSKNVQPKWMKGLSRFFPIENGKLFLVSCGGIFTEIAWFGGQWKLVQRWPGRGRSGRGTRSGRVGGPGRAGGRVGAGRRDWLTKLPRSGRGPDTACTACTACWPGRKGRIRLEISASREDYYDNLIINY